MKMTNETVEQVCLETAKSLQCEEVDYMVMSVMREALERIEAAYKREIEERNNAIKNIAAICRNLLTKDCAGCIRKGCLNYGENVLCVEHEDLLNKIKEAEDLANG